MIYYKKKIKQYAGATAIEYGILSALIAVATITGLQLTGVKLDNTYCYIATQISKAVGGSGGGCSASSSSSSDSSSSSADGSASSSDSSADSSSTTDSGDTSSSNDSDQDFGSTLTSDQLQKSGFITGSEFENFIYSMAVNKVSGITGIYDSNGDELTTTGALLNYINNPKLTADYEATEKNPTDHNILQITYDLNRMTQKKLYIPDMSNVSASNGTQTWNSTIDMNIPSKSEEAIFNDGVGDVLGGTATFGMEGFTTTSPSNDLSAEKYTDLNGTKHVGSYERISIPAAYYN